jgi:hypothetical protein
MRTARRLLGAAMVGALLGSSSASLAQTPSAPSAPVPPEVAEPPSEHATPDPKKDETDPSQPLTKKLNEGEGVLEPPRGIDPEMEKKPLDDFESRTPVIPPPGEPGGSQRVQPK